MGNKIILFYQEIIKNSNHLTLERDNVQQNRNTERSANFSLNQKKLQQGLVIHHLMADTEQQLANEQLAHLRPDYAYLDGQVKQRLVLKNFQLKEAVTLRASPLKNKQRYASQLHRSIRKSGLTFLFVFIDKFCTS